MRHWLPPWLLVALVAAGSPAWPQGIGQDPSTSLQAIRSMLDVPENQIDFAKAKLTIDRMIDPSIDVTKSLNQLDAMAMQVKSSLPANASSREKVDSLRQYLYQAGVWNGLRPFSYDVGASFHDIPVKLLPTYLATKKGNCVSMPLLFIVLGQRLGIDVTASTAPEHLFVKYRDDDGKVFNLEATSGAGVTSDGWISKQMPMTPEALASGIYMQRLTKKETVVLMLDTLMEHYGQQGQDEARMALATLALEHYPKDVSAMLHISSAYYGLRQRNFDSRYPKPSDVPTEQRPYLAQLDQGIRRWRGKAEALGWREPVQAADGRDRGATK